jgi:hypothetical protein
MSRRREEHIHVTPRQRVSVALLGLILMVPGIVTMILGSWNYVDYRNLLVFAPFSLLVGLVMIVFAVRIGRGK